MLYINLNFEHPTGESISFVDMVAVLANFFPP